MNKTILKFEHGTVVELPYLADQLRIGNEIGLNGDKYYVAQLIRNRYNGTITDDIAMLSEKSYNERFITTGSTTGRFRSSEENMSAEPKSIKKIIVNAREVETSANSLGYADIVALAHMIGEDKTVKFQTRETNTLEYVANNEGVIILDGMIFHVSGSTPVWEE